MGDFLISWFQCTQDLQWITMMDFGCHTIPLAIDNANKLHRNKGMAVIEELSPREGILVHSCV
jgi:hypothetical protein